MKPNFVNSFDPYASRLEESRKKRRCIIVSVVAAVLLLLLVVGLAAGLSRKSKAAKKTDNQPSPASQALAAACNNTAYPQSCVSSLSTNSDAWRAGPEQLVTLSINAGVVQVKETLALVDNVTELIGAGNASTSRSRVLDALGECSDNLFESMDYLTQAMSEFSSLNYRSLRVYSLDDIQTWLSSALTFYTTCFDGLDEVGGYPKLALQIKGKYTQEVLTNALSFFSTFTGFLKRARVIPGTPTRRLLEAAETSLSRQDLDFPDWIPPAARRHLLQQMESPEPNAVVAKDGSGQFISIQEAIDAAPLKSRSLYVILVKEGLYEELVTVPKATTNLLLKGEGIDRTIIQGRRSVATGYTTFGSASMVVNGRGFIGQGLTVENVAGPKGHQAVAVRVSADQVAFHRCSFRGYQNTLYAHSNRQFYRECIISGTVDFIFGNAAAVFQRCDVFARLPDPRQKNIVTAHGRVTGLQNTGFSFQGCRVDGTDELKQKVVPTFLGRPWKDYSRTVFMQSQIGGIVSPAGWAEWEGAPSTRYKTLFYGEYMNVGPGSPLLKRVNWSTVMTEAQTKEYTVGKLITGLEWLPGKPISFSDGIMR